jgi:hypothetical protein
MRVFWAISGEQVMNGNDSFLEGQPLQMICGPGMTLA